MTEIKSVMVHERVALLDSPWFESRARPDFFHSPKTCRTGELKTLKVLALWIGFGPEKYESYWFESDESFA